MKKADEIQNRINELSNELNGLYLALEEEKSPRKLVPAKEITRLRKTHKSLEKVTKVKFELNLSIAVVADIAILDPGITNSECYLDSIDAKCDKSEGISPQLAKEISFAMNDTAELMADCEPVKTAMKQLREQNNAYSKDVRAVAKKHGSDEFNLLDEVMAY